MKVVKWFGFIKFVDKREKNKSINYADDVTTLGTWNPSLLLLGGGESLEVTLVIFFGRLLRNRPDLHTPSAICCVFRIPAFGVYPCTGTIFNRSVPVSRYPTADSTWAR